VRALREKTGAGMMDCKRALEEAQGDEERAVRILREKGIAQVAKKASRQASEGVLEAYIHSGRIGVLVEVNCETDFVARNEAFRALAHDVAMQIAAAAPRYIDRDDVPAEEVERERDILRVQAQSSGKPPQVIEKMVEGRLDKFYEQFCLLEQPFIRDPARKVKDLVAEQVHRMGENIQIRRFTRFEVGGGGQSAERRAASLEEAGAAV
jgi:elongation factor Ts